MDDLMGTFYGYKRGSIALGTTKYSVEVKGVSCFI